MGAVCVANEHRPRNHTPASTSSVGAARTVGRWHSRDLSIPHAHRPRATREFHSDASASEDTATPTASVQSLSAFVAEGRVHNRCPRAQHIGFPPAPRNGIEQYGWTSTNLRDVSDRHPRTFRAPNSVHTRDRANGSNSCPIADPPLGKEASAGAATASRRAEFADARAYLRADSSVPRQDVSSNPSSHTRRRRIRRPGPDVPSRTSGPGAPHHREAGRRT